MTSALSVENLEKTYAGGTTALKGISFQVQRGDFMALLGPNGAGKSTTIGIICSLVNKTGGKVKIFDYDIDTDFSNAKRHIGVVPQELNFNQFEKVWDILIQQAGYFGIGSKTAKARTEKYLKLLGLWEKRNDQSRLLSGGMKRRLMIARALVHEPQLLILDEPTAGVDIELRRSMYDFLIDLNQQGTTIILTTHYLEEAEQLCRTIGIIDQGEIVENTTMKELLATLNKETFILDLENEINELPDAPECRLSKIDSKTLELEITHEQPINGVFDCLSQQGIMVKSMRNKTNRLEELFVSMINGHNTKNQTEQP